MSCLGVVNFIKEWQIILEMFMVRFREKTELNWSV